MKWRKLGLLYECPGLHPKLSTHVANCVPVFVGGDTFRIYFNARDKQNRSSVGAVDIDILSRKVVAEIPEPIFEYGPRGSFFEHGVSIGGLYSVEGVTYLSFMGWQVPEGGHWFGEVGRLLVNPDLSLTLDSKEPMLGLDKADPISISYPWIEQIFGTYHMWYGSTSTWDGGNGEMVHTLKHAVSDDGLSWAKTGGAIPYEIGVAQAFSRPTVHLDGDDDLTMWFSYRSGRGEHYRIGQSQKKGDGPWSNVMSAPGLTPSTDGWDSQMLEYPYVFSHSGEVYMLYNGNGYGQSGFGLAVLEN